MTRASAVTMTHHAKIPLHEVAKAIVATSGGVGLNMIVLGAGNGVLETRLLQDLVAMQSKVDVDLCLLDISQPAAFVGGVQSTRSIRSAELPECTSGRWGNFHRLGSYTKLHPCRRARSGRGSTPSWAARSRISTTKRSL